MLGKILIGAGVAAGAYFGYTELLQPYLAQRELEAKAAALQAKTGMSKGDALSAVASLACRAAVTAQGVPSNPLSSAACELAGRLASLGIQKGGKLAIKGLKSGAKDAAAVGSGTKKAVVSAAKKLKFWGLEGLSC